MNANVTKWTVDIQLSGLEGHTHARASLITGVEPPLQATGDALLSKNDQLTFPRSATSWPRRAHFARWATFS